MCALDDRSRNTRVSARRLQNGPDYRFTTFDCWLTSTDADPSRVRKNLFAYEESFRTLR